MSSRMALLSHMWYNVLMGKKSRESLFQNSKFWRYTTYFWSFALFLTVLLDYIQVNAYDDILVPLAAIYTATLGIYSADKEFRRWHHNKKGKPHPGEVFVILWTLLVFGILLADFVTQSAYELPKEISATYIVVLGILVITKRSKSLFDEHQNACRICDEMRHGH